MFSYIAKYKLNKAVKDYLFKLAPALSKRYSQREQYTVMQIEKTAQHLKLNMQHIPYAIAMYRHEESINTINLYRIDQVFLNGLRQEIADSLFEGNNLYTAKDLIRLAKPCGWGGGTHTNWMANRSGQTGF